MPVLFACEVTISDQEAANLEITAERLLVLCGQQDKELSILLVDDIRMTEINGQYRKKFKPTNVLSFPLQEEPDAFSHNMLGDIVISIDTAAQEALEEKITLNDRLTFLLIHGLLHLLGYDHERSEAEAARMAEKEQELLREFLLPSTRRNA